MIDKVWFYPPRREDEEITNKVSDWIKKNSLICQYIIDNKKYSSCIFAVIEDHIILVEGLMLDYVRDNWMEVVFKKEYKFKPGELVITRNTASSEWFVTTFSHIHTTTDDGFVCGDGCTHRECYPLKGNEILVGTHMNVDKECLLVV